MKHINRDLTEQAIIANCSTVKPLGKEAIAQINELKDGSFGFSYLAFLLYCNGYNQHAKSSNYPNGLIYDDGDTIFGVGVFFRVGDKHPSIHIVSPHGKNWPQKVEEFTQKMQKIIPEANFFVRHLRSSQKAKLAAWDNIETLPWIANAPQEDETFHHRILVNSRGFTRNAKQTFRRFEHFLERNQAQYTLKAFSLENMSDAEKVVRKHFEFLAQRAVGSTYEDYLGIITVDIALAEQAGAKIYIGYLNDEPVSFFAFERVSHASAKPMFGGYGTITRRDPTLATELNMDLEGFTAISTYALISVIAKLAGDERHTVIDFGGSETQNLDDGKKRMGFHKYETGWVARAGLKPSAYRHSRE